MAPYRMGSLAAYTDQDWECFSMQDYYLPGIAEVDTPKADEVCTLAIARQLSQADIAQEDEVANDKHQEVNDGHNLQLQTRTDAVVEEQDLEGFPDFDNFDNDLLSDFDWLAQTLDEYVPQPVYDSTSDPIAIQEASSQPFVGAIIHHEARTRAPSINISPPQEAPMFGSIGVNGQGLVHTRAEAGYGLDYGSAPQPAVMQSFGSAPSIISDDPSYFETESVGDVDSAGPANLGMLTPATSLSRRSGKQRSNTAGSIPCDHIDCIDSTLRFKNASALRHHKRKHTDDASKEHICEHCFKPFLFNKDLVRHYAKHVPSSLMCPVCQKPYKRADHRRRHMREKHPGAPIPDAPKSPAISSVASSSAFTSPLLLPDWSSVQSTPLMGVTSHAMSAPIPSFALPPPHALAPQSFGVYTDFSLFSPLSSPTEMRRSGSSHSYN